MKYHGLVNVEQKNLKLVNSQDTHATVPQATKVWYLRWLYVCLAWLCIAIAGIGLFIPGLPPFDFLLLAAFFAAKGSPKLHAWMMQNRYIGPILKDWQQHRRLPRQAKIFSSISMSIAALIILISIPILWLKTVLLGSMGCVLLWIWLKT